MFPDKEISPGKEKKLPASSARRTQFPMSRLLVFSGMNECRGRGRGGGEATEKVARITRRIAVRGDKNLRRDDLRNDVTQPQPQPSPSPSPTGR